MVFMDAYVFLRCQWMPFSSIKLFGIDITLQIVLGSIVTRCPSMSLAPSALVQLDSACELFSKAADGFGAQKVLVSLPNIITHYQNH
jgi:hypothetical protein